MNKKSLRNLRLLLKPEYIWPIITVCVFGIFLYYDPTEVYKIFKNTRTFYHSVTPEVYRFYSFGDFLSPAHIFLMAVVYGLTAIFGYGFLRKFFSNISANIVIKLSASFLVGYVCSLVVIRLVSFILPNGLVFYPSIIIILGLSTIEFLLLKKGTGEVEKTHVPGWKSAFISLILLALLFFIILLIQVYAGEFAWVGHGPHQYSWLIEKIREGSWVSRFPIIVKHHDELLYTYFMLDPTKLSFNAILPMWVTLALNKVSFFSLAYCLFRFLKIKPHQSIVGALFLLFGTNALNPLKYLLLFDSSNPLAYVVQSTRIVGIGIAFLLVVNILSCKKNETGFLKPAFFIFTAIGLIFTTFSNAPLIIALNFVGVIFLLYPNTYKIIATNLKIGKIKIYPIYIVNFIFIMLAFGYGIMNTTIKSPPGLVHFATGLVIFSFYVLIILLNRKILSSESFTYDKRAKSGIKYFALFVVITIISSIFVGNVFSSNKLNHFIVKYLNQNTFITGLKIFKFGSVLPLKDLSTLKIFQDGRYLDAYNEYCKGVLYFLAYYGSIYILALLSFWSKIRTEIDDFTLRLRVLLLFTISILPFLFFHIDFIVYSQRAWIKTRFLEIPIYFIIFSSIILVFKSSSSKVRNLFIIFLLAYIVMPIIGTDRIQQWVQNAVALKSFLK